MCKAVALYMLCVFASFFAFYMTSACLAQGKNQIKSLDGVVFPAGLTELSLVSLLFLQAFVSRCVYVVR